MGGELSIKMSAWLEHVRSASEQGVTIAAYAATQGLSTSSLYQAKSQLMKLGAWPRSSAAGPRTGSARSKRASRVSSFVPVRLTDGSCCRLSHVSGWTLTLEGLPSAQWLMDLVRGATHVAA